jgi:hypothetical protein
MLGARAPPFLCLGANQMSLTEQLEKPTVAGKGSDTWASTFVQSKDNTQGDLKKTDAKFQAQVVSQFGDLQLTGADNSGKPTDEQKSGEKKDPTMKAAVMPSENQDSKREKEPTVHTAVEPESGNLDAKREKKELVHAAVEPESESQNYGPGKKETAHWKVIENGKEVEKDVPVRTWEHNGVTVQIPESYKGPITPGDIFASVGRLPYQTPMTVVLRDDQPPKRLTPTKDFPITGEIAVPSGDPSVTKPELRIYPGENKLGKDGDEVIRHEWTHAIRDTLNEVTKDMYLVGSMLEDGLSGRPYAGTNPEENWAVHTGEEFLSPDRSRFEKLMREQPLKAAIIAVTLRGEMNAHPDNSEAQQEARKRCDEAIRNCAGRASEGLNGVRERFKDALISWSSGDASKMKDFVRDTFKRSEYDSGLDNPMVQRLITGTFALLDRLSGHGESGQNKGEHPSEGQVRTDV